LTRCHVCRTRLVLREEFDERGQELAPDLDLEGEPYRVDRNGLRVQTCWRCWFLWPDDHKLWPGVGYGRPLEREPPSTRGFVRLFQETA
jgi:hypothetical protein